MGLLDPQILQGLMLLRARHGETPGILQSIMQGQQQARQQKLMEEAKRQQMEMQRFQMEQAQKQAAEQDQIRQLGARFGQPLAPQPSVDDQGNPMPPAPAFGMQDFAKGLMGINPMQGIGLMSQLDQQQAPKLQFAPDGTVVDMRRIQPGQSFAKQPDWKDPDYERVQSRIRAAGQPQVSVVNKQETEFSKAVGKQQGESYSDLMKADAMASGRLNKLSRLESLLASSGKTGKLTPATMELKSAAESLGFKVDPTLPFQQAAQALSSEIALELRNPSGGAGMPGALSDKDREFLQNMVPNLAKTPEGNRILLDTAKRLAQREKDVARLAREYRKRTGRFDEGFYDALAQYSERNPLFPDAPAQGSADPLGIR